MKKIQYVLPIFILLLALTGCNYGTTSPSELAARTEATQGESVQLPNVSAGGDSGSPGEGSQPGESVFLPSLGAGEEGSGGGAPGTGDAEVGGGVAPGAEDTAGGAFIPNVSAGEGGGEALVDAYVDLQASALSVRVGETITFTARPVQIGLPFYYLVVRDEGVQDAPPMAQVTYENVATLQSGSSQVVAFISAQASMEQAVFVVKAIAPGVTTVGVTATGEITTGTGVTWSGAGSGELVISVMQ